MVQQPLRKLDEAASSDRLRDRPWRRRIRARRPTRPRRASRRRVRAELAKRHRARLPTRQRRVRCRRGDDSGPAARGTRWTRRRPPVRRASKAGASASRARCADAAEPLDSAAKARQSRSRASVAAQQRVLELGQLAVEAQRGPLAGAFRICTRKADCRPEFTPSSLLRPSDTIGSLPLVCRRGRTTSEGRRTFTRNSASLVLSVSCLRDGIRQERRPRRPRTTREERRASTKIAERLIVSSCSSRVAQRTPRGRRESAFDLPPSLLDFAGGRVPSRSRAPARPHARRGRRRSRCRGGRRWRSTEADEEPASAVPPAIAMTSAIAKRRTAPRTLLAQSRRFWGAVAGGASRPRSSASASSG